MANIAQVVGQRMEFQEDAILVHGLFILLTAVLLIAYDGFEIACREVHRIVPYQLVVFDLLEGQRFAVTGRRS